MLSKNPTNQLFVSELLSDTQSRDIVHAYFSNRHEGDLARGKYLRAGDFSGFHRIKIREQIERLETEYKTYKEYSLGDLSIGIYLEYRGNSFKSVIMPYTFLELVTHKLFVDSKMPN